MTSPPLPQRRFPVRKAILIAAVVIALILLALAALKPACGCGPPPTPTPTVAPGARALPPAGLALNGTSLSS
jgi:hypothetical protein